MAAAALTAQLNTHVATMYTEGVVDEDTFEELRENGTAAEVARFFINNAYQILDHIRALIEQPAVHFDEVEALVQQLMECTSSVGAQQVNLACRHFRDFNARKYEHGPELNTLLQMCLLSLTVVRTEFSVVRNELEIMMQL